MIIIKKLYQDFCSNPPVTKKQKYFDPNKKVQCIDERIIFCITLQYKIIISLETTLDRGTKYIMLHSERGITDFTIFIRFIVTKFIIISVIFCRFETVKRMLCKLNHYEYCIIVLEMPFNILLLLYMILNTELVIFLATHSDSEMKNKNEY